MDTINRIAACVTFAAFGACVAFLSAPNTAHSDMPEYPSDTSLVSVREIGQGTNWVGIRGHYGVLEIISYDTPITLDNFVLSPDHFNPDNPNHMYQVQQLGDYTCGLYNKQAVVLSQVFENQSELWYLVACALP